MLVKHHQIRRALTFKDVVVEKSLGRSLDLLAYGSLVEYYARYDQLGSALLTLRECLEIHGSPPAEKSLTKFQRSCRKHGLEDEFDLVRLIGPDPLAWIREGKAKYKRRERSSNKGNHDVQKIRNLALQI